MGYDPQIHHRRSIRLPRYDYSRAGAYYVTVCADNRECLFGQIMDGQMRLSRCGAIVAEEWLRTAILRPTVALDEFVIMPNHVHGIIVLHPYPRGTLQRAPTDDDATDVAAQVERFGKPTSNTIPTIVRLFKSVTTRRINEDRQTPGVPVWQRNYYEHVIRDEAEWDRIRAYIATNPARWCDDMENPNGKAQP